MCIPKTCVDKVGVLLYLCCVIIIKPCHKKTIFKINHKEKVPLVFRFSLDTINDYTRIAKLNEWHLNARGVGTSIGCESLLTWCLFPLVLPTRATPWFGWRPVSILPWDVPVGHHFCKRATNL